MVEGFEDKGISDGSHDDLILTKPSFTLRDACFEDLKAPSACFIYYSSTENKVLSIKT